MTCDEVREFLLSEPVASVQRVAAHLDRCASCRALAQRIHTAEQGVAMEIEAFIDDGDFAAAWDVAAPAPGRRRLPWQAGLIAVAAAAALLLALPAAFGPTPPEPARRPPPAPAGVLPAPVQGCPLDDPRVERAMGGALRDGERACLEDEVIAGGEAGPDAFRVLLVDAWAANDLERWEGLVLDHLDEMEPDLELLEKVLLYFTRAEQERDRRVAWAEELGRRVEALPPDQREPHQEVLEVATKALAAPKGRRPYRRPAQRNTQEVDSLGSDPSGSVDRLAPRSPAPARSVDLLVFLEGAPNGVLFIDGERVGHLASRFAVPAGAHVFEVRCQDQLIGRGTLDVRRDQPWVGVLTLHDQPSFVLSSTREERHELCR